MTILIVDNLSPFTSNILQCINELGAPYIYKKFSEIANDNDNNVSYDKVILSGRKKNSKECNVTNSRIIKDCFVNNIAILGIEDKNYIVIVLLNQQKATAIRSYVLFGGVVPILV